MWILLVWNADIFMISVLMRGCHLKIFINFKVILIIITLSPFF